MASFWISTAEQFRPFDLLPQPVWCCDETGACIYANSAWLAFTGLSPDEVIGQGFLQAIDPADRAQVHTTFQDHWIETEPIEYEIRMRTAGGPLHWMCVRSQAVRSGTGLIQWVSTAHDIHALKLAEHSQARRTDLTRRLLTFIRTLAQAPDLDAALDMVLEGSHSLLKAHGVMIYLLNQNASQLMLTGSHGYGPDLHLDWLAIALEADLPVTEAARTGQPVWFTEEQTAAYPTLRPLVETYGIEAIACLPLLRDRTVIGVLLLDFTEPQLFDAEVRTLLLSAATEISQVFIRTELRTIQKRSQTYLMKLNAVAVQLSSSLTLSEMHQVILQEGAEATEAFGGFITVLGADGVTLLLEAQRGYSPDFTSRWRQIPVDARIPVQVARRMNRSIFLSTREAVLAEFPDVGVTLAPHTQALAVLPLRLGTQVFGTLTFSYAQPHSFDVIERQFLEALATPLARILQRGRVFEAEQRARQQAEEAIRQQQLSHESLRILLDSLPNLVWILTPEGEVQEFNQQWPRFSGMPREMSGLGWMEVMHPEDREPIRQARDQGLRSQQAYSQEMRIRRLDGVYRWHTARVVPVWLEGQLVRWVGSATDIDDQKRTEELLTSRVLERTRRWQDLNMELKAISTTLAGSLEEPLRRIVGIVQLIGQRWTRLDQQPDPRTDRLMKLLGEEAERLTGVTQEIRNYANLEARELHMGRVPLDLLVIQVRSDLESFTRNAGVRWQVGWLPAVQGDALLLRQVFAELFLLLLSRARGGLEVAVDGTVRGAEVEVRVEANSRFSVDEFEHLLTPRSLDGEDGAATGLANMRRIVIRHGGLVVAHPNEGGSVVVITLPLWLESEPEPGDGASP